MKNWPPNPVQQEAATRAWATRRANKFNASVRILTANADTVSISLDELRFVANEVSDQLAAALPEDTHALPRAYSVTRNGWGERGIAHGQVLFSPAHSAPAPSLEAIQQLGRDLKTGWLVEVVKQIGRALDFGNPQERER